jgi:5-methylcytosine-specific restriction endonuclease McrA
VAKYQRSERGKESLRRYVTSPKGRLARIRRRELEMAIDTLLSPQDIETIYRIFDSQCFNCRSMNNLHIDHHRPLSKGFGLSIQNATLLCGSCNSSKGDKSPEEFYTADQLKQLALILGEQYGNRQK